LQTHTRNYRNINTQMYKTRKWLKPKAVKCFKNRSEFNLPVLNLQLFKFFNFINSKAVNVHETQKRLKGSTFKLSLKVLSGKQHVAH